MIGRVSRANKRRYRKKLEEHGEGRKQILKYERKSTKRGRARSIEETESRKSKVESEGDEVRAGVLGW